MEGTSSTESPAAPLRDEGLLALMRAFPLDILGKVVLSFLSICDEKRLWAKESAFRTVYTWCMATHCDSGLRRRKEGVWPLIRSTVAVFSQDRFDWTDKVGRFRQYWDWSRKRAPGGAVRDEWDMVKHGDIVLKYLCVSGAVVCDASTLAAAARAGSVSTVRYLIEERGVDSGADHNYSFRLAASNGHIDVVQLFLDLPLDRGVDPGASDNYALRRAAEKGHTDIVQLLLDLPLDRGVDPTARDNDAFRWTVLLCHTGVVQLLLALPIGRRPSRAVVQNQLSKRNLSPAMVNILAEHLAEAEPA